MLEYVVPSSIYPDVYHVNPVEPIPFISSYEALNIGRLDMEKTCIRFNKFDKSPYDLIGELFSKVSFEDFIIGYELNLPNNKKKKEI